MFLDHCLLGLLARNPLGLLLCNLAWHPPLQTHTFSEVKVYPLSRPTTKRRHDKPGCCLVDMGRSCTSGVHEQPANRGTAGYSCTPFLLGLSDVYCFDDIEAMHLLEHWA